MPKLSTQVPSRVITRSTRIGSAEDGPEWQKHIGNKKQRRDLANQFKDAKNPFEIVIVRDMWLTGFDAPCLHTMYADKSMQGHGLMQAIARAKIKVMVKRILNKHGYPPDLQEEAVKTVLAQAELLCAEWV
jgi:hypothetical protein